MMRNCFLWVALTIGVIVGASGVELVRATVKPAAYMVVEYEMTDRDAFQAYIKGVNALPSSRVFLARHARATALSGDAPKWVGIVKYSSLEEAMAFENSPEFQALIPARNKGTKWRAYVVEGLTE